MHLDFRCACRPSCSRKTDAAVADDVCVRLCVCCCCCCWSPDPLLFFQQSLFASFRTLLPCCCPADAFRSCFASHARDASACSPPVVSDALACRLRFGKEFPSHLLERDSTLIPLLFCSSRSSSIRCRCSSRRDRKARSHLSVLADACIAGARREVTVALMTLEFVG